MELDNFKMGHFDYEMTGAEVADQMFLNEKTVFAIEKRAIDKLKKIMAEKGITAEDLLG
jgi:DNA-directed RNA polymerase specialized sigma24 family protein